MPADQISFEFKPPTEALPQLWTPDDVYANCDQNVIRTFAEDRRVERKRVEIKPVDFAAYLSMWANTQPSGGVVFVGVDKDGKITGCAHASTDQLNGFETAKKLCPDAKYETKRVPVKDFHGHANFVIAVRVYYRAEKLVETVSGESFIREGDEKRRLTEVEKREIRLNKGELNAETETVPLAFPANFDNELLEHFRRAFISKRSLQNRYDISDVLQLCKLGKKSTSGFEPNLACAILFARDPREIVPGAFIRVFRYEGSEEGVGQKMNAVADQVFEGPLPVQILNAERFIESQIRNFTRLGRDTRFVTMPEYPKDVWLEAVVNAAVHRSYNLRHMNIYVKLFEDKMVVESPGAFFPPTTAATVYDAHNPRNPNLMWAMYYFDYVQCAYEGTRRMRRGMQEANLPEPIFTQREAGIFQVQVTLKNNVEHRKNFVRHEAMPSIDPLVYEKLTEKERMLVNFCADGRRITVKDAQMVLGRLASDWRAARAVLVSLTEKRVFDRPPGKERDRHRKWFLRKSKHTRVSKKH